VFALAKNELSESAILQGLRSGSSKAVEHLYLKCRSETLAWLKKNDASAEEAEDVFQEAILALTKKAIQEPELQFPPSAYLFGAARRIWYKLCQMKGRELKALKDWGILQDNWEQHEAEPADADMNAHILQECLALLKPSCQDLLRAYYFKAQDMSEIAVQFGYKSADVAKESKYRCFGKLKKLVREKLGNV
jgi:RNA polymerase sigma factor (sigma-70 family)